MTRRGPADTLLVAVAVFLSAWPVATRFEPRYWLRAAGAALLIVALSGMAARALRPPRWVVLAVQAAVLSWAGAAAYASSTLWYGLPTLGSFRVIGVDIGHALADLQKYSAPAPVLPHIEVSLVVAVAVAGLVADALSQTWRAPAAAGAPMLILYLSAAASGNRALNPLFFIVLAALWALIVVRSSERRVRRWSTTVAMRRGPDSTREDQDDVVGQISGSALGIGATVIVVAVLLGTTLPHLPTRYLIDGLGRAGSGTGGGVGKVGLSTTLDVTRSLEEGSNAVVLRYTTTDPDPGPLRVSVASALSDNVWRPGPQQDSQPMQRGPVVQKAPSLGTVTEQHISVTGSTVPFPYVAVPDRTIELAGSRTAWQWQPTTGVVRLATPLPTYAAAFGVLNLSDSDRARLSGQVTGRPGAQVEGVDSQTAAQITALAHQVAPRSLSPFDQAIAIQNWLRAQGGFSYSLTLDPARPGESPEQAFLRSQRGYCVQFATTMLLMAQAMGIPGRMAIGYLPGTQDGDQWVVHTSDAHAWPELYFNELGWVRFEPTPGVRTGLAPQWTQQIVTPGPTSTSSATVPVPTPSAVTPTTPTTPARPATTQQPLLDRLVAAATSPWGAAAALVLLLALATLIVPITAWVLRRRRHRRASSPPTRVEETWNDLVAALTDLGVPPAPTGTLREQAQHYGRAGLLDTEADQAFGRVLTAVEQVRYSPEPLPTGRAEQVAADCRRVAERVRHTRRWRERVRAALLPGPGRQWWQGHAGRWGLAPLRALSGVADHAAELRHRVRRPRSDRTDGQSR